MSMSLFKGPIIHPLTGEDITHLVHECLKDKVNRQRFIAMRKQRKIAQLRNRMYALRDAKGNVVAVPKANICTDYYHGMIGQRREENKYLRDTNGNCWEDPDFLKYALREEDSIRARVEKQTRYFPGFKAPEKKPAFNPSFNLNQKHLLVG